MNRYQERNCVFSYSDDSTYFLVFYDSLKNTSIFLCILLFSKCKRHRDICFSLVLVLFIDKIDLSAHKNHSERSIIKMLITQSID
jgi:hypothetical protein